MEVPTTDPIGILGLGAYAPERVMTNDDWADLVDTTDEWITARTGIEERRFAAPDETSVDLAATAAERALADAGLTALAIIDEIIVATDTPEIYTPDTAAFLQHRLGAREIPAYDMAGSGCAGFVQALDVAPARAREGRKTVLVVGGRVDLETDELGAIATPACSSATPRARSIVGPGAQAQPHPRRQRRHRWQQSRHPLPRGWRHPRAVHPRGGPGRAAPQGRDARPRGLPPGGAAHGRGAPTRSSSRRA